MTHWIAGEWVAGTGEKLESHTPYSHELLWQGYSASGEQVDAAVKAARRAFLDWKNAHLLSVNRRCWPLRNW